MNKNSKKQRLVDLQGVLLKLIEYSEDDDERLFLEDFINKTENKLKEL